MIRQVIIPTDNTLVLHLPDDLVDKKIEVIAFSSDDITSERKADGAPVKRTIEEARKFFAANAVDFTKVEKWNREDLYD